MDADAGSHCGLAIVENDSSSPICLAVVEEAATAAGAWPWKQRMPANVMGLAKAEDARLNSRWWDLE